VEKLIIPRLQQYNLKHKATFFSAFSTLSFSIIAFIYHPSIFINGRIWAEEGKHFLEHAHTNGAVASLMYVHKRHMDFIPNLASFIAIHFPRSWTPYVFPAIAFGVYIFFFFCCGFVLKKALVGSKTTSTSQKSVAWIQASSLLIGALLLGAFTASTPWGIETFLNTINSWAVLSASFAILLPWLEGNAAIIAPMLLMSTAFPVILFSPYVLLRWLTTRSRQSLYLLIGSLIGATFQTSLVLFTPIQSSLELIDGNARNINIENISLVPGLMWEKLYGPLLGMSYAMKDLDRKAILSSSTTIIMMVIIALVSIGVFYRFKLSNKRSILYSFNSKQTNLNALIPTESLDSLLAVLTWQFFAFAFSHDGASVQLQFGAAPRYFATSAFVFYFEIIFIAIINANRLILSNINSINPYKLIRAKPPQIKAGIKVIGTILLCVYAVASLLAAQVTRPYVVQGDVWCFQSRPEFNGILITESPNREDIGKLEYKICPPRPGMKIKLSNKH